MDELTPSQPGIYRIRLAGRLNLDWADDWEHVTLTHESGADGQTCTLLTVLTRDQAELHGLLNQVRDLGLTLLWVERVANEENDKEIFDE